MRRSGRGERRCAGDKLVGETADRVDVDALIHAVVAGDLLGRHVRRACRWRGRFPSAVLAPMVSAGGRDCEIARAMPKSVDLRVTARERMFSGLMSRWTMPRACRTRVRARDVRATSRTAPSTGSRVRSTSDRGASSVDERHRIEGNAAAIAAVSTGTMHGCGARRERDLAREALGGQVDAEVRRDALSTTRRPSAFSWPRRRVTCRRHRALARGRTTRLMRPADLRRGTHPAPAGGGTGRGGKAGAAYTRMTIFS